MRRYLFLIPVLMMSIAAFPQVDGDTLCDVVVTGTRVATMRENVSVPVSIVKRDEIEAEGETEIIPVLSSKVPGFFVTTRGVSGFGVSSGAAGDINMRGFSGSSGRILMLIDGHPVYSSIYGHPIGDSYMASDAERVEVLRGPASVLYGSNAMGGAVNIITRKVTSDGNRLSARLMGGSFGSQKYTVTDSFKKNKFSAFAGANYDKTDGHRANSAFSSLSGFVKMSCDFSERWRLLGDFSIVRFNAENPGTVSQPIFDGEADVLRTSTSVSLDNTYEKTSGSLNFYYQTGKNDVNDGHAADAAPRPFLFHSNDYMAGINAYQSFGFFKGNTVTAGFDAKLYGGDAYRNPVTEYYADHKKLYEVAGYVFARQSLGRLSLNAGIRLSNHKLYGNEWIPQAGLGFKASSTTNLKFTYSKGFRSPSMKELYMYAVANEDLLPERANSLDLTAEQSFFEKRIVLEMSLFYIKGDNLVEVCIVDGVKQNRNIGEFANKGVEFQASYKISDDLKLSANYNYLHLDKVITGAPRQKIGADVSYRWRRLTFGAEIQHVDCLYLSEDETESYLLADARMSFSINKNIEIFCKGENLLDKTYETMLGFPMPGITVWGGIRLNY